MSSNLSLSKDLLQYVDMDELETIVMDELSDELITMFVDQHPGEAIQIIKESFQISQLEMFLEEGNRKLQGLKRKRGLNQQKALQRLQSFNQSGLKEATRNKSRR